MSENIKFEIVEVAQAKVICDGGNPAIGHPQVYLHIKDGENEIDCPYCSRTFRLSQRRSA